MENNQEVDLDAVLARLEARREKLRKVIEAQQDINRMETELLRGSTLPVMDVLEIVTDIVADNFGILVASIKSHQRTSNLVDARHIVFYLVKKYTDVTVAELGRAFDRDHVTVSHGVRRIEFRMAAERSFLERVVTLDTKCLAKLREAA